MFKGFFGFVFFLLWVFPGFKDFRALGRVPLLGLSLLDLLFSLRTQDGFSGLGFRV